MQKIKKRGGMRSGIWLFFITVNKISSAIMIWKTFHNMTTYVKLIWYNKYRRC